MGVQSPAPPPGRYAAAAAADDDDVNDEEARGAASLNERHRLEIETAFDVFDSDRTGRIDLGAFEVLVLSLGFRMTRAEIVGEVAALVEEWDGEDKEDDRSDSGGVDEGLSVDLSMAMEIILRKGYDRRDPEDEIRMYFRIFDGGNKGHVSIDDLRRVLREVREEEKQAGIADDREGRTAGGGSYGPMGDATLRAMIEEFDRNLDGVIDFEEFRRIMEPHMRY